jgi:hypothetical protein
MRLPRPKGRYLWPTAVGLAVLGALWVAVGLAFLSRPPALDFLGDMFWVDVLSPHLLNGTLPAWNSRSAMGHPLVIQRMNLMLFLPAIAIKALVRSTETAAKIYFLLGHSLSGFGFYLLARLYTRRRSAAALGALLYLVAPVHVAELRIYGHWALAQSFALCPVVLALMVRTVREEGRRGLSLALILGGAATWLAWADGERTATFLPLAFLFAAYEVSARDARARARAIGRLGLSAAVVACLSAGFLLPAILDRKLLALNYSFPDLGFRFSGFSHPPFELWHPVFILDRFWSVSQLPFFKGMMHPLAHVHVGWVSFVLAMGAVLQSRKGGGEWRRLPLVLLVGCLLLVQTSMGTNTIVGSTYESLRLFLGSRIATASLLVVGLLTVTFLVRLYRRRGAWVGLAWTAGVAYLAIGAPFLILSRFPPFGSMRNPLWFLTINLPILLSLLSALFLDEIDLSQPRAGRALVGFMALAWLDLWPYLWIPTGLAPGTEEAYRFVGRTLDDDPDSFRFAWVPLVTAGPEEAYADRFTGKRDYGSWLLWCSGKWGGRAVARGFAGFRDVAELARRHDPRVVSVGQQALRYFALCDVKYLLVYRNHERFTPLFGHGLTPVMLAGQNLVARNEFWKAGRALQFPEDPNGRLDALSRPDEETIEANFTGSGPVFVSEAFYPYWKAELDGRPVPVEPMQGGFIGLHAPNRGSHRLRLHFETPWYYGALALLSIVSLAVAAAAFAILRRRSISDAPPSGRAETHSPNFSGPRPAVGDEDARPGRPDTLER